MTALVQYGCALLGFVGGFALGIIALLHITRGENVKALLDDPDKKLWLGLFGWFFAAVGAWTGWQLSHFALSALGY